MPESSSIVTEWVRRANDDWKVVQLSRRLPEPLWEIASFHAQQSAEKYMKAFLIQKGWKLKKTHDLTDLLSDCIGYDSALSLLSTDRQELTPFALAGRYPTVLITSETCKSAIAAAERIRAVISKRLDFHA
jgi:HEPN domain-containing protein